MSRCDAHHPSIAEHQAGAGCGPPRALSGSHPRRCYNSGRAGLGAGRTQRRDARLGRLKRGAECEACFHEHAHVFGRTSESGSMTQLHDRFGAQVGILAASSCGGLGQRGFDDNGGRDDEATVFREECGVSLASILGT
jgi:hypothetical protein